MKQYTAKVFKSGGSYALRIPKQLVEEKGFEEGDVVELGDIRKAVQQDHKRIWELFEELHRLGAFAEIDDPVAWQREIRQDRLLPGRD